MPRKYDIVTEAIRWHVHGLMATMSEEMQVPIEQLAAEVANALPKLADHAGQLARDEGYNAVDGDGTDFQPQTAFILMLCLAIGASTYGLVQEKIGLQSSKAEEDRAEVNNFLRDIGLGGNT